MKRRVDRTSVLRRRENGVYSGNGIVKAKDSLTVKLNGPARRGSVLILALWTLFFLAALALAVNARVAGMMHFARFLRNDRVAYDTARAGVDQAMTVLMTDVSEWDGWMDDEARFRDVRLGEGFYSVTYPRVFADGSVKRGYGLIGEEAKVNVNKAGRDLLAALFRGAGGLDSGAAAALAQRILDERGDNDKGLTKEAEGRYGRVLKDGGVRSIGPFESLHELLLVQGMSREVFERVRPYATLYGTGKINLNAAARPVLLALADSAGAGEAATRESLALKLARYRESGRVFKAASETAILKDLESFTAVSAQERAVLRAMLGGATLQSTFFSGQAEGRTGERANGTEIDERGGTTRRIAFVLDRHRMARADWREF